MAINIHISPVSDTWPEAPHPLVSMYGVAAARWKIGN